VVGQLAVVQDDALFLALVDPESARADSLTLPAGASGARLFDDVIGNKADKLDLESAFVLGGTLYAFGSGSTPARELVVSVRELEHAPIAEIVPAHRLCAARRDGVAGSELNLGVALVGDQWCCSSWQQQA
jgi:hypothetical protein